MQLPGYYSEVDEFTRLSYGGPTVYRSPGAVGDYVPNISGLGQTEDVAVQEPEENGGTDFGYFLASSLGSALAGSIVGYMASGGTSDGTFIGAATLGGVTGLSDASIMANEGNKGMAMLSGLISLTSIAAAFYMFTQIRR